MHFANDLQKMCGISATALPAQIPTILAYGNDDGWENMFSNAMDAFRPGDVLVAISCSGSSPNVVNAAILALRKEGKVIAMTGPTGNGNKLAKLPVTLIVAQSFDIKVMEDVHSVVCHAIAGAIADDMQGV
jgi:D-sedoheptulose 7-phosphate isomerase